MPRTTYPASRLSFIANYELMDLDTGHQIDWAAVPENSRTTPGGIVTVGAAGAAASATSIPLTPAAPVAIPAGTKLDFTGAGKFALVTADAAKGATSLTVEALPQALVSGDTATVAGSGNKFLPAGTVVGELASSTASSGKLKKVSPRVASTNPAIGLLASDAVENDRAAASTGYGVYRGGAVYENLLPDATGGPPATLAGAIKTELQTAGVTTGWRFDIYADDR